MAATVEKFAANDNGAAGRWTIGGGGLQWILCIHGSSPVMVGVLWFCTFNFSESCTRIRSYAPDYSNVINLHC
ncbi:hypothetical protein ACJ8OA_24315, partial [Serratia sp. CY68630]|uniref:hypothetical protein n=1 Tax=Serratia sp. CY68630 TaxID=3383666 RepID=UPI003FA0BDE1